MPVIGLEFDGNTNGWGRLKEESSLQGVLVLKVKCFVFVCICL